MRALIAGHVTRMARGTTPKIQSTTRRGGTRIAFVPFRGVGADLRPGVQRVRGWKLGYRYSTGMRASRVATVSKQSSTRYSHLVL